LGANLALALNNSATGRISAAWSARLRGSREGASDTRSGVEDAAVERCADCWRQWDPPAEDSTARGARCPRPAPSCVRYRPQPASSR